MVGKILKYCTETPAIASSYALLVRLDCLEYEEALKAMITDFRRTDASEWKTKFSKLGMVQGNTKQAQRTHSWLPRGSNQHAAMQYLLSSADGLHHDLQKFATPQWLNVILINNYVARLFSHYAWGALTN